MTTSAKLTLKEFLELPEEKPYSEFFDGEVVQKPMPGRTHKRIQYLLCKLLEAFFGPVVPGEFGQEWRCVFGPAGAERAFVPDFLYVSEARDTGGETLFAAPELIAEILSPEQSHSRLADKIQFYLMHGVLIVWLIDPFARTITLFTPDRPARTLRRGDVLEAGDAIPGFSVPVADIFAVLDR